MTVIARDNLATDHLVYCWPLPIGPECQVACSDEEQVVMCPAWMVGDRLGPGRHRWRTPDPNRPVAAFFVLTAPVEVTFDMVTAFALPQTGQGVRLRAAGSLQVRCADPGLLVAQFVGLPFDQINEGVIRSVRRSLERMLARLLIRRVIMAGTPTAITDAAALPSIIEELVAYNPTAGAVFGVELTRIGYLNIAADDGTSPQLVVSAAPPGLAAAPPKRTRAPTPRLDDHPNPVIAAQLVTTARGPGVAPVPPTAVTAESEVRSPTPDLVVPGVVRNASPDKLPSIVSGEIGGNKKRTNSPPQLEVSGEIDPKRPRETISSAVAPMPTPAPRRATSIPSQDDEATTPTEKPPEKSAAARTKSDDGSLAIAAAASAAAIAAAATAHAGSAAAKTEKPKLVDAPKGAGIIGIGMGAIGTAPPVEETKPPAISVGGRVLVPGPNGLMQSATVRQAMQGYYELEIGATGQTLWVPVTGVVPD